MLEAAAEYIADLIFTEPKTTLNDANNAKMKEEHDEKMDEIKQHHEEMMQKAERKVEELMKKEEVILQSALKFLTRLKCFCLTNSKSEAEKKDLLRKMDANLEKELLVSALNIKFKLYYNEFMIFSEQSTDSSRKEQNDG